MFACVLTLGCGCRRNEVKVHFELPSSVSDAYKMVYYASDPSKGWYVETVAAVQGGKAEIELPMRNPMIVFIMGAGSIPRCAFYAERGDEIKIKGDSGDPRTWRVTGNKMTEAWTKWRLDNADAFKSGKAEKINAAVSAYVKKNPENPLSTILVLSYYDRSVDEPGFRKTWEMLKGDALQPKWIRMVARADVAEDAPRFREPVDQMIVTSIGNGVDTIKFKGKPLMIYFWRDEDAGQKEDMEKYRVTAAESGDSSKRIMADISFDPDSSGWVYRTRRDSVRKSVRGWIYKGEVDSVISRLHVPGTPWFVVCDSKGKFLYEGSESAKADSLFRTLIK